MKCASDLLKTRLTKLVFQNLTVSNEVKILNLLVQDNKEALTENYFVAYPRVSGLLTQKNYWIGSR